MRAQRYSNKIDYKFDCPSFCRRGSISRLFVIEGAKSLLPPKPRNMKKTSLFPRAEDLSRDTRLLSYLFFFVFATRTRHYLPSTEGLIVYTREFFFEWNSLAEWRAALIPLAPRAADAAKSLHFLESQAPRRRWDFVIALLYNRCCCAWIKKKEKKYKLGLALFLAERS